MKTQRSRHFLAALLLLATLGSAARTVSAAEIELPSRADWRDFGIIFEAGSPGEWDLFLAGAFAGSVVKRKGVYYLYYQGASGYREIDDSVTGRAIGLAQSPDGINFVKYEGNPILTWQPNGNGEEGAVSSATYLHRKKKVILYYGANTEESATTVNADGRLAISSNGTRFRDRGKVLNHRSSKLWGSGDEIFPIIALRARKTWIVYYIPNGTPQSRTLGVAWGKKRKRLDRSAAVRSNGKPIDAWGMGGTVRLSSDQFAIFTNDVTRARMEVRLVSPDDPARASGVQETYRFNDFRQGTVLLDEQRSTWFLYYRNSDQTAYGVKTAPAGEPDDSGPLAASSVRARRNGAGETVVTWEPALDPETGVAMYEVYRNGELLGTTSRWRFHDRTASLAGDDLYAVRAVNLHGVRGERSALVRTGSQ